jgi:hypothetical protein
MLPVPRTSQTPFASTIRVLVWSGPIAAMFLAWTSQRAVAQMYRVDEADQRARANLVAAKRYVNNPDASPDDRQRYLDFFTKYFFQAMTRTDPSSLAELASSRDFLIKQVLWGSNNKAVQAELTKMSREQLSPIVDGAAYHPTVRVNAVLMLGMLNDEYLEGDSAKPHLRATADLIRVVDSATVNANYPPAVILGALTGLERHAQLRASLPPAAIDRITGAALKLVVHDQPIQGMDGEVYDWLRYRAASVLAQLGSLGQNNQVYSGILQLVGKLKSLDDRCDAAALLAKLTYNGAKVDATITSERLLKLASDIADAELARAIEFEGKAPTMSFNAGRGDRGDSDFTDVTAANQGGYPRRPLLAHLLALRQALTATRPALPADTRAKFDAVASAINPTIEAASSRDAVELGIASRVREMAAALKRIVAASPAAPAATTSAF